MQKYKNIKISLSCPLAKGKLIEFPGRCLHCDKDECADLRNLIIEFFN